MQLYRLAGMAGGAIALCVASLAHAECTKDLDCKGERVCDAGQCVALPMAPAAPPAAASTPAPAPAQAPAALPQLEPFPPQEKSPPPKLVRHSKGMMVGGIVMVSLSPVALLIAGVAGLSKGLCGIDKPDNYDCTQYDPTIYGSLLSALVLVGVGVPLIVIGATKEPATEASASATVGPWATPTAAGIGLRLEM